MPKGIRAETAQEEKVSETPAEAPRTSQAVAEPPQQEEKPLQVETFETEDGVKLIVFPQIRVGVCEFHGSPHGNVDLNTLKGRCRHDCKTDPYCPHSKTGCEYRDILELDKENNTMVVVGKEKRCRHEHNYQGLSIRCSYCPQNADMRGVIKSRTLYVFMNPQNPGKLIVVCSDYRCQDKFQRQYVRRNVA